MEKKRKRASFSISAEPPKPSEKVTEVVQGDPSVKQVVEVVVQDKTQSGKAPNINIVIPQPQLSQPKIDSDVAQVVNSMPNLIDDGTDQEPLLPPQQRILTQEITNTNEDENSFGIEDDSVVTASATPQGDTVVVRTDPEYEDRTSAGHYQRVVIGDDGNTVPQEKNKTDSEEEGSLESATESSNQEEEVLKKNPIKIHTNISQGVTTNTDREAAVAELFGNKNQSVMPEITVHKHAQTKGIIIWALTMVALALGVGGGLVLFTSRQSQPSNPVVQVSPTPIASVTPSIVPTAVPTPILPKRSEIRIQVLNGGGTAGAGSRMKTFLEEKGYRVIETRNADSYTYETTEIILKGSKASIVEMLVKDLEESYELGETKTDLSESSSYDVRVIVGSNE